MMKLLLNSTCVWKNCLLIFCLTASHLKKKHEVLVFLEVQHDLMHIEIIDDGIPFDPFAEAPQT